MIYDHDEARSLIMRISDAGQSGDFPHSINILT